MLACRSSSPSDQDGGSKKTVRTRAQKASANHTGGHPQRWLGGTLNELRNRRPALCSTIVTTSNQTAGHPRPANPSINDSCPKAPGEIFHGHSSQQELTSRSAIALHPSVPFSYRRRLRGKPKQGRRHLHSDQLASLGGTGYYDPRFIKAGRATWKEGRALQPTSAEQWDDNNGGDSLELSLQWEATREGGDVMVIIERVVKTMLSPSLSLPPFYDEHVMGVQGQCGCQERRQSHHVTLFSLFPSPTFLR